MCGSGWILCVALLNRENITEMLHTEQTINIQWPQKQKYGTECVCF